jgi:hypothetical protein
VTRRVALARGARGRLTLGGFAGQAFVPRWIGRHPAWGFAPGWQREIALWNVGRVIVIANAIWSADPADMRAWPPERIIWLPFGRIAPPGFTGWAPR